MKLVGFLQMFNEASRGNLNRCLDNLSEFTDSICVYDDASTDNSVEIASGYTKHIIRGEMNDLRSETSHKQQLLELAMTLKPDFIFWLDADEVLDRPGTEGGLRELCKRSDAYQFEEVTLWRSQCWRRMDYLGRGQFRRLWPNNGKLRFNVARGLHLDLFPQGLGDVRDAPFKVIHYGYADADSIARRWVERTRLGVPKEARARGIDEAGMVLEHVPHDLFPKGCEPVSCEKPMPMSYDPLIRRHRYLDKENYVHTLISLEWRSGHLNPTIFEEQKNRMRGKILYLGCNAGTSLYFLAKHCDSVVGVDINAKAIEAAEQLLKDQKNISLVCCDACKMPLEDGSFDGAYALQFFEHIYPEDMELAVREVCRVLKKNSYLIVEFPHPTAPYYKDKEHVSFFDSAPAISKLFSKHFEIEDISHNQRPNPGRPWETHNDWFVVMRKADG